jgi:hypothetical protein
MRSRVLELQCLSGIVSARRDTLMNGMISHTEIALPDHRRVALEACSIQEFLPIEMEHPLACDANGNVIKTERYNTPRKRIP